MKIFVTVGHTQYNSLIKAIDDQLPSDEFDITIQLADGDYIPRQHQYFRFTEHIEEYFNQADLVITHAGAGTVFQLLDDNKKMLVIPNSDRVDDHQMDLADYVQQHNYAFVCNDLNEIRQSIQDADKNNYCQYDAKQFNGYELIDEILNQDKRNANIVGGLPLNLFKSMQDAVDHVITDAGQVIAGSAIAINPEKVIRALNEPDVRAAIMSASIRYADGIGVVKTLARKSKQKVSRIPGCELWEALMEKSGKFSIPVYLVGATPKTIALTKDKLEKQYNVNVCGFQDGYFNRDKEHKVIQHIAQIQPQIVTVALGSPRQEIFIQACQKVCPNSFFMGVGGTYDVYTNTVKRAPKIYQKLNLEWFYRLMSQPKRLFRQSNLVKYLYLELTRQL